MIKYKIDIIEALKNEGYTTYTFRNNKMLSQGTLKKLKDNDTTLTLNNINVICKLLNCQPGEILEYVPD